MRFNMRKKTSQSGRSMVEMLGVIAIIGLITVAGITSMGYVDSYFRSSATVIEIDNLAKDVLDTYSWSRDFSSLDMTFICSEGILKCTDEKGSNRWGGAITVSQAEAEEGIVNGFIITYTNVPKIPCEQLVNSSKNNEFHYVTTTTECTDNTTMEFHLK